MPLGTNQTVGFIPASNAEAARVFYEQTLGLYLESDDQFALVFRLGPARGTMLRVIRAESFTPQPFTIFGWEVPAIEEAVDDLTTKGVSFLRFPSFHQDERGIWTAPNGSRIAWFKDPDSNTLSLSQHSA